MVVKARQGGQGRVRSPIVGAQQGGGSSPGSPTGDVGLLFQTDFTVISSLPAQFSLARATTANRFNSSGILTSNAIDAARFDFDQSTLAARGLLIEGQRTNLLPRSNPLSATEWTTNAAGTKGTSANLSPDGTADASTIGTAGALGDFVYQGATVAATDTFTVSMFPRMAAGTGKSYLSLQDNSSSAVSSVASSLTTAWQRASVSRACTSTDTVYLLVGNTYTANDASASFEGFGGQLEQGAFATSYIPSSGVAATRSADILSSNTPLTGYLAAGPSVWEFQDEATGTISRTAYAAGAFDWPVYKWYRSMGVYSPGTDTSGHMTVGSPY